MGREIERKFLVLSDAWRAEARGSYPMRQGYMCVGPPAAVRVRIAPKGAHVNIKRAVTDTLRDEFEYAIPEADAEEILARCCVGSLIEKVRHEVPMGDVCWEIDEFQGANAGLVVAEVELPAEDWPLAMPAWVGAEVSADPRYLNASLCLRPYVDWA